MKNLPPFPAHLRRMTSEDSSSSSGGVCPLQVGHRGQSVTSSEPPHLNQIYTYLYEFEKAISPRMKHYEAEQERLVSVIEREKIIEESTRRLLQINLIAGVSLPVVAVLVFFLFCSHYAPENVKIFFEEYKVFFSIFSITTVVLIAKPLYDIHNFGKRLDAIEKKLKLNGND